MPQTSDQYWPYFLFFFIPITANVSLRKSLRLTVLASKTLIRVFGLLIKQVDLYVLALAFIIQDKLLWSSLLLATFVLILLFD